MFVAVPTCMYTVVLLLVRRIVLGFCSTGSVASGRCCGDLLYAAMAVLMVMEELGLVCMKTVL